MRSKAEIKLDTAIGHGLRIGVSAAAVVVFAGWILLLVRRPGAVPHFGEFHGSPALLTRPSTIFGRAHARLSDRTIMAGILLLLATPVARVVMCIFGFALEKDRLYVVVSSLVLAVLLYSLLFRS